MTDQNKDAKAQEQQNKDAAVKPEPETLHTTDPQDKMEGPVSSLVQKLKDSGAGHESQVSADKKRDENM